MKIGIRQQEPSFSCWNCGEREKLADGCHQPRLFKLATKLVTQESRYAEPVCKDCAVSGLLFGLGCFAACIGLVAAFSYGLWSRLL